MTDKEMATSLGMYVNSLLGEIEALKAIIAEYGDLGVPVAEAKKRISQEESFRRVADGQQNALLQIIGDETLGSALIRALYRHFVGD